MRTKTERPLRRTQPCRENRDKAGIFAAHAAAHGRNRQKKSAKKVTIMLIFAARMQKKPSNTLYIKNKIIILQRTRVRGLQKFLTYC